MSEEQKQLEQAKETLKEAAIQVAASEVEHRFALDKYKIKVNELMGVPNGLTQPEVTNQTKSAPTPPQLNEEKPEEREEEKEVDKTIDEIKSEEVEVDGSSKDFTIDEVVEKMENMTDEQRLKFTHGDGRKGISYQMRVKHDLQVQGLNEEKEEEKEEPKEEKAEEKEEKAEEKEEPKPKEEEKPKAPPAPSKPEAPKAPEKPTSPPPSPTPPPPPAKAKESADESPKPPEKEKPEEKSTNGSLNGSQKVDLPDGLVRPDGSPECFGNSDVYDETTKKCMTCIYDFECKEAIEEMAE